MQGPKTILRFFSSLSLLSLILCFFSCRVTCTGHLSTHFSLTLWSDSPVLLRGLIFFIYLFRINWYSHTIPVLLLYLRNTTMEEVRQTPMYMIWHRLTDWPCRVILIRERTQTQLVHVWNWLKQECFSPVLWQLYKVCTGWMANDFTKMILRSFFWSCSLTLTTIWQGRWAWKKYNLGSIINLPCSNLSFTLILIVK